MRWQKLTDLAGISLSAAICFQHFCLVVLFCRGYHCIFFLRLSLLDNYLINTPNGLSLVPPKDDVSFLPINMSPRPMANSSGIDLIKYILTYLLTYLKGSGVFFTALVLQCSFLSQAYLMEFKWQKNWCSKLDTRNNLCFTLFFILLIYHLLSELILGFLRSAVYNYQKFIYYREFIYGTFTLCFQCKGNA